MLMSEFKASSVTTFSTASVLDAMEGIAYLTDPTGTILSIGHENWTSGARDAGAEDRLAIQHVVGSNLYEVINGDDVKAWYRDMVERLIEGQERQVSFIYRCDAPEVRREMRMCMSVVRGADNEYGVLYQSLVVNEESRPPISLFDPEAAIKIVKGDKRPIVTLCSMCAKVRADKISVDSWVASDFYYRLGGKADVRVSHGICPTCFETVGRMGAQKRC